VLKRPISLAVLIIGLVTFACAQSASRLIREGDRYYEHNKFRSALQYYKQGGNAQTWKKDVKLRTAICQYEVNELDGAIFLLSELVREGKTEPVVFLYLGKCYHHKQQFGHAVNYYKEYLRRDPDEDQTIAWVKDEILRCANGITQRYAPDLAYAENMGANVNSFEDDYAPVPSPNYEERIYFTSARKDSEGGLTGSNGLPDPKFGSYTTDLYYVENVNGIWQRVEPLDHVLNSRVYEELFCFSPDGQQLYYKRGKTADSGDLVIDTFSSSTPLPKSNKSFGPFNPRNGDKDLFLYNDTIMLFSSNRSGGHGGFDIYYCVKRKGRWREATNLGRAVNSFYDDVTPFLARDGRVLYISSNRLESIGGLDVFEVRFDDQALQWLAPVNLGLPINSAGDDAYFKLAIDGQKAYFSSDRKIGFGQRDLYVAYFKEQVREHLTLSVPLTFIQLAPADRVTQDVPQSPDKREIREYVVSDLWFEPNDVIITPQNIKKLEVLTNLLLIYPTLTLDLICHDVPSGPRSYNLFFSVKKAEQVADYLAKKGIARSRMFAKGCGAYYPIANSSDGLLTNPAVSRLNRRIEIHVFHAEEQPLILTMDDPLVPESLRDERGMRFDRLQEGLVYRVQIAETGHLYQHEIFDDHTDAMVDFQPAGNTYRYLIGMETNYNDVVVVRDALRGKGFPEAFIVPYVNGVQLSKSEALRYAAEYPDLLKFTE
jgi:outer membrane protein OmpA-like peptidoglycan-associated protein